MADVIVYQVLPPDKVVAAGTKLASALFGMRSMSDGNRSLYLSRISGALRFVDKQRLWHTTSPAGLPTDVGTARASAERWLQGAQQRLVRAFGDDPMKDVIPSNMVHVSTRPARADRQVFIDHWLSIFAPVVANGRTDGQDQTSWVDATFELRMGPSDLPYALTTTWRPRGPGAQRRTLGDPPGSNARLLYRTEAAESPQVYLAPYYVGVDDRSDDGDVTIVPASGCSPMATIVQDSARLPITLTVRLAGVGDLVNEGRRPFVVWAYWRPDTMQRRTLGENQQIVLDQPGVYNVIADVGVSLASGRVALLRAQALVYAQPADKRNVQPPRIPVS